MRLAELHLQNFLSHEDEHLVLLDRAEEPINGIFYLAGGSTYGKSSLVIDAQGYVLYGPVATRVSAAGVKQEDLRHNDHPDGETRVEALYVFDDKSTMRVIRGFKGPAGKITSYAEVWEPNPKNPDEEIRITANVQESNRYVRSRLGGLTAQNFLNTFVSRQDDVAALLSSQTAARRAVFHGMLGVTEIDLGRKELTSRLTYHNSKVRSLTEKLGGRDQDEVQAELDSVTQTLNEAQQALHEREEELAKLVQARESGQAELEPLRQATTLAARIVELTEQQGQIEAEIAALSERASAHNAALALACREEELRAAAGTAETELYAAREDFQRAQRAAEQLAALELAQAAQAALTVPEPALVAAGSGAVADRELTVEEIRRRQSELRNEQSRLAAEHNEIEERLERLRGDGTCYVCQRPFSDAHDHEYVLDLVTKQLQQISTRSEEVSDTLTELGEQLPAAEAAEAARADSERERIAAEAQVAELDRQYQATLATGTVAKLADIEAVGTERRQRFEQANKDLAEAEAAKARLDERAATLLSETEHRHETVAAELASMAVTLDDLGGADPEAHQRLTDQLAVTEGEISACEGALPVLRESVTRAESIVQRTRTSYELFLRDHDELVRERQAALRLQKTAEHLERFMRFLVDEIRPALEELGSEMLHRVSSGQHTKLHLDDDYNLWVTDADGHDLQAPLLCGGERDRAAICLRLALACLASQRTGVPLRTLILDEPLGAQDPEHVAAVMALLDSLRGYYPAMFLVSHVGDLANADEVDYVLQFSAPPGRNRVKLLHA
jgi:DNA repair exonuclease SbcCD ATPase subunit